MHTSARIPLEEARADDACLRRFGPSSADVRLRLICCPHAGAGASVFREWSGFLPAAIDVLAVQLPGRETRVNEPRLESLRAHVDAIAPAVLAAGDMPLALFGHSMGAVLAFELAHIIWERTGKAPAHLFVSGAVAPQVDRSRLLEQDFSDEGLTRTLERLNGTPAAVLADAELTRILLPTLRADLLAHASYAYETRAPLPCPVTAIGGTQDEWVAPADLEAWAEHTRSTFRLRLVDGNHFFVNTRGRSLCRAIRDFLVDSLEPDPAAGAR